MLLSLFLFMFYFFFFNDTATTEIYTLSLHDALPIWPGLAALGVAAGLAGIGAGPLAFALTPPLPAVRQAAIAMVQPRSEEHTSELQSQFHLVCRLLLEKKKKKQHTHV